MVWESFAAQQQFALELIEHGITSTDGKALPQLKEKVKGQSRMNKFRRNITEGRFTRKSDYHRVFNEMAVAYVGTASYLLDASSPEVGEYFPEMGISKSAKQLIHHRDERVLVENQVYCFLWEPKLSKKEKFIIGSYHFVKLGLGIAAAVATFGASAPALVLEVGTVYHAGVHTVQAVIDAGNSIKEIATPMVKAAKEIYDQGKALKDTLTDTREKPDITGFKQMKMHRDFLALDNGGAKGPAGMDITNLADSDLSLSQEDALKNQNLIGKYFYVTVQQVTPVLMLRSDISVGNEETSYKGDVFVLKDSVVRMGGVSLASVGALVPSTFSETQLRPLLYPWITKDAFTENVRMDSDANVNKLSDSKIYRPPYTTSSLGTTMSKWQQWTRFQQKMDTDKDFDVVKHANWNWVDEKTKEYHAQGVKTKEALLAKLGTEVNSAASVIQKAFKAKRFNKTLDAVQKLPGAVKQHLKPFYGQFKETLFPRTLTIKTPESMPEASKLYQKATEKALTAAIPSAKQFQALTKISHLGGLYTASRSNEDLTDIDTALRDWAAFDKTVPSEPDEVITEAKRLLISLESKAEVYLESKRIHFSSSDRTVRIPQVQSLKVTVANLTEQLVTIEAAWEALQEQVDKIGCNSSFA